MEGLEKKSKRGSQAGRWLGDMESGREREKLEKGRVMEGWGKLGQRERVRRKEQKAGMEDEGEKAESGKGRQKREDRRDCRRKRKMGGRESMR